MPPSPLQRMSNLLTPQATTGGRWPGLPQAAPGRQGDQQGGMGGASGLALRCNPSQNATQNSRGAIAQGGGKGCRGVVQFGLGLKEWLYLPLLREGPEGLVSREPGVWWVDGALRPVGRRSRADRR